MTERDRVAALQRLNLVDSPAEERFDRITRTAKNLFDVPIAAVTLVDDANLHVKSPQTTLVIPREESFCNQAITDPGILVVPDATADRRFAQLPGVSGPAGIRFYAGRPLNAAPGMRVGTLCLYDTSPRELSADQLCQLDELGAWAEAELQDSADRDRARSIQQALLPSAAPAAEGYEVLGMFLPRSEVGGDFYSWKEEGPMLHLAIADVMGSGTGAALMAATVRGAIHRTGASDPGTALDIASDLLNRDLERTATFATAFLATLDRGTGTLSYADAGHGLSMIVSPDGSYTRLHAHGLPLGLGEPGSWVTSTAVLRPGDTLASFTDGVLDLYDGTLAALDEVAALIAGAEPAAVLKEIGHLNDQGVPDDDLSAGLVRRLPVESAADGNHPWA